MKRILGTLILLFAIAGLSAQDFTARVVNPSFEQNLDGWTNDGMSPQGNNVFTLKVGKTYCEKWTGKGGQVGKASITQLVKNLKAGAYTVKAVAQNIQEDTPTTVQSGAFLVANTGKTSINVTADYEVQIVVADGQIELGMQATGATGNYLCIDNFRLVRTEPTAEQYTEMHQQMQTLVNEANTINQHQNTPEQTELDAAKSAVASLISQNTCDGVTEAVVRLQEAIYDYRLSVASPEAQVDMTSLITNPSFEQNGTAGWVNVGMGTQTGGVFPYKGTYFVEAWTWHGGHIGDVSVSQRVQMPNGKYTLTAVAQNIQQGSNDAASKGGYIFAESKKTEVGKAMDYSVEFVVIEGQANIGFRTISSTGNWVAVDNFRISYMGRSDEMLKEALDARCAEAEALISQHMNKTVLSNLQQAIAAAKSVSDTKQMTTIATNLRLCMEAAQSSIIAYAQLLSSIGNANSYHRSGTDDAEFLAAIAQAQQVYDSAEANEEAIAAQIAQLETAVLKYCVANTTGTAPKVETVHYVARGATGALGRSIVSGGNIKEKGFCWATHPEPTVLDNRTTFNYDINGPMYLMQPLEPATVYYVRAYAMTNDYAVGYGEVRKVITLPMGNSGYWYNWGGSPDENTRIDNALKDCIYYYNNWSATTNFNISCSYGSGTPTADCSYGGSMRVGPNPSYQRTGTILHESNHGVGVGTSGRWWDTNLHDGAWKGYRANSLLQFIENNPTATMAGDGMHMWPYGINGAHEDSGWPMLYIANVMITQALHEDGLIPPGHGGCKPAYVFEQDDNTKYYITSENSSFGSGKAYLTESSTGVLSWSEPTGNLTDNDAYAWYFTFDPQAQLYSIRNAKSGRYFNYGSGIKTTSVSQPGANEKFHLMVGRQEKNVGTTMLARPYWIMAGNDVEVPATLTAQANGKTSAPNFDISDGASAQRWFILTADEVDNAQNGAVNAERNKLMAYINAAKAMLAVPHEDAQEGVSDELDSKADTYLNTASSMTSTEQIDEAITDMWAGMKTFLKSTILEDEANPYDLTFLVQDAKMQSADVWGQAPTVAYNCGEYFMTAFTMQQVFQDMPLGKYEVCLQGFQRPGPWSTMYDKFVAGTLKSSAKITVGVRSQAIKTIMDDAQLTKVGRGTEQKAGDYYIPDNMEATEAYFDKGLYMNSFVASTSRDNKMTIKFTCSSTAEAYWTIFRNMSLHYLGNPDATSIEEITVDDLLSEQNAPVIFDLQGRRVARPTRGLYIINGQKVIIK